MLKAFRKNERFYHLHEQKSFFSEISIICSWGTSDSNHGGSKIITCKNALELEDTVRNIVKIRKSRGYLEY